MAILEETVKKERLLSPAEFLTAVRAAGLKTPAEAESLVREDRDARSRR